MSLTLPCIKTFTDDVCEEDANFNLQIRFAKNVLNNIELAALVVTSLERQELHLVVITYYYIM